MAVRFFKSLWGMESLSLPDALARIAEAGYEGVEAGLESVQAARALDADLPLIAMLFEESPETLAEHLEAAGEVGVESVTVHAGKDWWDEETAFRFFEASLRRVEASGLIVNFETHRGRLLFNASSTAATLQRFPEMRLCADFSHWTCVSESLLEDQAEALVLAISRTRHLHARIGHEEGPQVPDPRSPRWARPTERFLQIWDEVWQASGGDLTVDPEFGPPHYLWTDAHSGEPAADLWEVCLWMRDTLRDRWGESRQQASQLPLP
ncbi:sugar phosphate isomerase/epimerase [bacterium]|nr:MAG: sugar phosphate isomerase/epimerase [bacterium]